MGMIPRFARLIATSSLAMAWCGPFFGHGLDHFFGKFPSLMPQELPQLLHPLGVPTDQLSPGMKRLRMDLNMFSHVFPRIGVRSEGQTISWYAVVETHRNQLLGWSNLGLWSILMWSYKHENSVSFNGPNRAEWTTSDPVDPVNPG